MNKTKTTIGFLAAILTLAIAAVAFAHGGYERYMGGYGGHMMGPGYEDGGHMMGHGPGYGPHMFDYGAWGDLSDEEASKLKATREKFFKETRELRNEIDEKQFVLRDEMIKDNPNEGKVIKLQKQISELQAKFDQKALDHQLKVGKLIPERYQGRGFRGDFCW